MKYDSTIISVVMVVKDNWPLIKKALEKLSVVLQVFPHHEIVLIDNCSEIKTVRELRTAHELYPTVRVLILSKEMSPEVALTAGLENTIGDHVVLFNPLTDPAEMVVKIITELSDGYDMVLARFPVENYLLTARLDRFLISLVKRYYKRDVFSYANYLSGFNRQVVASLGRIKRKQKNFSYLNAFIGFRRKLLSYKPIKQTAKNIQPSSLFSVLFRIASASLANSEKPLRLALLIALGASLLNFSFLLYVLVVSLIKHNLAEGWLTTSVMIGTMFLLLFLVLAILAEYILRIWDESHQEPVYFISSEVEHGAAQIEKRLNIV